MGADLTPTGPSLPTGNLLQFMCCGWLSERTYDVSWRTDSLARSLMASQWSYAAF